MFSLLARGASLGQTNNFSVSPWGEYLGYPYYAIAFAFAQSGVILLLSVVYKVMDSNVLNRWYQQKPSIVSIAILLLHFLYLPVNLAVYRLYYCNNTVLAADSTVQCGGTIHIITTVICTILIAPVTIGLPLVTYWIVQVLQRPNIYLYFCLCSVGFYAFFNLFFPFTFTIFFLHVTTIFLFFPHFRVKDSVIYRSPQDHEKRLQGWELSYLLNFDDFWLNGNIWMTSSFVKFGSYYRLHMLLYKLALLSIYIFLRSNLPLQAFLFWILLLGLFVQYGVRWPYRCVSSNVVHSSCLSMLLVASSFALANALGVTSSIMVASIETMW